LSVFYEVKRRTKMCHVWATCVVKLTCSTATAICVENPGDTLTPCSIVSGCSFGSWNSIYRRRRFTHTPRGPFPYRGTHRLWPL